MESIKRVSARKRTEEKKKVVQTTKLLKNTGKNKFTAFLGWGEGVAVKKEGKGLFSVYPNNQ